jgi:hypothetical protein
MSKWPMQGHFRYLRFKTSPMTSRTSQCEVFCPLLSSSEHSGVPADSKPPTFPSVGLHPHTWPKWGCDSYSPRQDLSNYMWHATCTLPTCYLHATCRQVNRKDFWLLVVGSQIDNLIPNLSFDHNLCFKYPNGSCEPISNIYVPRSFQWYKKLFNVMNFDPLKSPFKNLRVARF